MKKLMTDNNRIVELRGIVRESLMPLINGDYVFLDVPYYENLGDTMIWEGTLNFLKEVPHKCLYSTSKDNYVPQRLGSDTVILLQGGGNFGDLWPEHQEFRKRVMADFPENPIVVLPQSVWYDDEALLKADAAFFGEHPNVVICVRDSKSKEILESCFTNRVMLVPDMALFVDVKSYLPPNSSIEHRGRSLLLRRGDKEAPADVDFSRVPADAEICDWPTIETYPAEVFRGLEPRLRRCRRLKRWLGIDRRARVIDRYWRDTVRPAYMRRAVEFVDGYDSVWSTRLHVAILAMLLGKEVHVLDNSYRKTTNFLNTWFPGEDFSC